jgi:hypothetical protein
MTNFSPTKWYPEELIPDGNLLQPLQLIHSLVKFAVTTAHSGLVSSKWDKKNAEKFLEYLAWQRQ